MSADSLPNLPSGMDVLLDVNIFVYAFSNQSADCRALLERCAKEEVCGITTVEIINEVTHRLMLAEAVSKRLIEKGQAGLLRGKAEAISGLTEYWNQALKIFSLNLLILSLEESRLHRAGEIRAIHGLLTNDSVILAALDEYGIECLASRDSDFDHIPGITVYKPMDLA
ncbi:MAG TPA: PIN domain-containing protein [bacterium]|nr:PIN domain-containing protein [bacterium]